jgi:hypothetical protein
MNGIIITEMNFNNETSMSPLIVHDNCGKLSKKDSEIDGIIQLKQEIKGGEKSSPFFGNHKRWIYNLIIV